MHASKTIVGGFLMTPPVSFFLTEPLVSYKPRVCSTCSDAKLRRW